MLTKNFLFYSVHYLAALIVPIVIVPLAIQNYGEIASGQLFFNLGIVNLTFPVISFGSHFIGVNRILETNKIDVSYYLVKGTVAAILSSCMVGLAYFFQAQNFNYLFICLVLIEVFNPFWILSGLKRVHLISISSILIRLTHVFLFLLNLSYDNYIFLYILTYGLVYVFLTTQMLFSQRSMLERLSRQSLVKISREGFSLMVGNVSTKIYSSSVKVIVGTSLGMSTVNLVEFLDKILAGLKLPSLVLARSMFLRDTLGHNGKIRLRYGGVILTLIIGMAVSSFILLNGARLTVISGIWRMPSFYELIMLVSISSAVAYSQFIGVNRLLKTNKNLEYTKSVVIAGFIFLVLVYACFAFDLLSILSFYGCMLVAELVVIIIMENYERRI